MPDAVTPARSADAGPLGRPYKYKHVETAPRPAPKTAYGFILGPKCCMRWARWYYKMANPGELATLSPEEAEELLQSAEGTSRNMLPGLIYSEFPNLPRLHNRLLPVAGEITPQYYIFVLRDDATWQGMNAPLRPEGVEAVRQRLGVGDQEPHWYRIDLGAR
ncbi:hypothetical protein C8T65DRAFT_738338 [Cerioporus squamosus]|nr:hypothetical protein C8T65DRAFT_738338 [Cerioporus squamosus]